MFLNALQINLLNYLDDVIENSWYCTWQAMFLLCSYFGTQMWSYYKDVVIELVKFEGYKYFDKTWYCNPNKDSERKIFQILLL